MCTLANVCELFKKKKRKKNFDFCRYYSLIGRVIIHNQILGNCLSKSDM